MLEGCYSPKPHVEAIENVADFKQAFTPDATPQKRYPSTSLMNAAKNLRSTHFYLFSRNKDGRAVLREKLDVDVADWSEPDLFFKNPIGLVVSCVFSIQATLTDCW